MKNGTNNYSILSSVSYGTKGLKSNGNNIVIYDSSSDDHWQFIEATCDGTSANYVDTHVFDLYQPDSSTIKYKCIICGKELNTPEYDDRNILDDADYMTVYTLQQLYKYKLAEGEPKHAEACLRAIDKIRTQNIYVQYGSSQYSYKNASGQYVSPIKYSYTSYDDIKLRIRTNQQSWRLFGAGIVLNTIFNNILPITSLFVPFPFNLVLTAADIAISVGAKNEYGIHDAANTVVDIIGEEKVGAWLTKTTGQNWVYVSQAFSKVSKITFIYDILNDFYQFSTTCERLPYNYYIGIDIYDAYGVDTFIGDYGYQEMYSSHISPSKHKKNIINENYDLGTHNTEYQLISGYSCKITNNLQYDGSELKANFDFNW